MPTLTRNSGVSGSTFEPAPEGNHKLVLCDVVDHGWIEKSFDGKSQGLRPTIQFVYQTKKLREDDKPFLVFGRKQTLSLDDRSNLRKELDGLLGKKEVDRRLDDGTLDTEEMIGTNARGQIVHEESRNGSIFANIANLFPYDREEDGPLLQIRDYQRRCEREDYTPPEVSAFADFDPKTGMYNKNHSAPDTNGRDPKDTPMTNTQKAAILDLAQKAWGESFKREYAKRYLPFGQMTEAAAGMCIREIQGIVDESKASVPPEDDYDDADPFGDQ